MSMMTGSAATVPERDQDQKPNPSNWAVRLRRALASDAATTAFAIVLALAIGAVLIAVTNTSVQNALGYFAAKPSDTFSAVGAAVGGAYAALFRGGVYDTSAVGFTAGIQPILTSLSFATPLLLGGLGIALSFRAGLFNIGGQGQILVGGAAAGWVGFAVSLPPVAHLLVAIIAAIVGGAVWAGVAGVLRARFGAHEVITTIMLNYVAFYLVDYLLRTPVLGAAGSSNPVSPPIHASAVFPNVPSTLLTSGIVLALVGVVVVWWILDRSSIGYRMRAVGINPRAARFGGMSVAGTTVIAMMLSGAFTGSAGAYQVLANSPSGFANSFDAGIGFTAITVALLGRSRPFSVAAAAVLFGVLSAGGYTLQASQNVDLDIISVLQAVIVLFIAAPPLIRGIFRLPAPGIHPKESR